MTDEIKEEVKEEKKKGIFGKAKAATWIDGL